jgi:AAHS family 3-hydroxyphenylpropionic acid transporter
MPNFIALASQAVARHRRVIVVVAVSAALPLGGAIAGLTALTDRWGWGWRAIFYVGGCTPLALSLLIWLLMPEPRAEGTAVAAAASPPPRIDSVPRVLFGDGRLPTTLTMWGGFFFTQLILLLMLNWLPSLFVGLGFDRAQASWAAVCFNLAGAVGGAVLGRLHSGRHRRVAIIATYVCIGAALVAVARVSASLAIALAASALAGAFIVGATLILFAVAPLYYDSSGRATGVGAAVAAGRLGSVFGPLFAAVLLARGNGSVGVLLGMEPFVIIGGVAAWALGRRPAAR